MVTVYTVVFLASLVIGIMLGLPIAYSLILSAAATALSMGGSATNPQIVAAQLMRGTDSVTMMALPFFILVGELMNRGGLTKRIISFCNIFVGRVRGGLGYVTILACLMFASLVGSAVASTAALGAILIPMMVKSGYDRAKATGLLASANLVAPIMPPSVPMIVYGVTAGVSIKSLFLGGIAPAVYLTVIMCIVWFFVSKKDGIKEDTPKPTFKETVRCFIEGMWALFLPIIIIAGLRCGVFTATEAGVVAVVYALVIGLFVYRELKPRDIFKSFIGAAKMSAVVMFLAAAAQVAAYILTISRIPQLITQSLAPLVEHPMLLNFVLQVIIILMGTCVDVVPTILIMTPIMLPLLRAANINLVYFGVVFTLANVLGLTSPPVGPVLNVACATGKVKMDKLIPKVMPYYVLQIILVFLLIFIPQLITVPLQWIDG
ncbi:TRAP transporter large permease [Treponema brennaborense]|uniref:TRAP dicarboxylate transporter, DctM subunit n=1 Tax=Treponema brennaborense (strain DSM 12168 / CIP 105900 / DD5/3) TaxID=906968 RepID=F4LKT6_TREBD|nr:TRAP transporter large permease [Treponema brennaborense]AEE15547.1 TRAP dicarboxylate transporter, DctM subunit [Treponema brennaborense DSM 12168]